MGDDKKPAKSTGEAFRNATMIASIGAINPALGVLAALDPGAPERITLGINEGARDFVRDVPWAITWLWDKGGEMLGYDVNTSDRGISSGVQQSVEDFWDAYIKRASGLGGAEFRMASGWQLPKGMKYDGQLNPVNGPGDDSAGKPITEIRDITAIFYKDHDGNVEVLTRRDHRWSEIVGPYIATQIGAAIASMGTGAAAKAAISLPRPVTWGLAALGKISGTLETAGSMGFLGYNVIAEPLYFKPQATSELTRMLTNPGTINTDSARSALNTLMSQYSAQTGAMTEQNYLPSLHNNESPWTRLSRASVGTVDGFKRDNPFDDIRGLPTTDRRYGPIPNTNIRNLLQADPGFQRSLYDLANRALNGGMDKDTAAGPKLTDQEAFALRFMLNASQDLGGPVALPDGPIPKNNHDRREQRAETLGYVQRAFSLEIANQITAAQSEEAKKKAGGASLPEPDPSAIDDMAAKVIEDPDLMRKFAASNLVTWKGQESLKNAKDDAEAVRMGQTMAMSMIP